MFKRTFRSRGIPRMQFGEVDEPDCEFFFNLFDSEIKKDVAQHIDLAGCIFSDIGEQSVIIIRKAYEAILPHIEARWGAGVTMVTGTPGIGKTYLGAYHLRLLVRSFLKDPRKGLVCAYFRGGRLYVFTWDKEQTVSLGLTQSILEEESTNCRLSCGVISNSLEVAVDAVRRLLGMENCYVIADPQDKDDSLALKMRNGNLVIYASHGHPIIRKLESKRPILHDSNTFVLPGWSEEEFRSHIQLLKLTGGGTIPEKDLSERIKVGGKMLRFLVATSIDNVKKTMKAKISEVVKSKSWNNMEDVISPDFNGSLISLDICESAEHVHVGETRNRQGVPEHRDQDEATDKNEGIDECAQTGGYGQVGGTNPFSRDKAELMHVSDYVIEQLEVVLKDFTSNEIGTMAESWSSNGYMSVFGALFERHSHVALENGMSLPLYAVLPGGGKSQKIGTLEIPPAKKIFLLEGNNPQRLQDFGLGLDKGAHVRPVNPNLPTYDLYVMAFGAKAIRFDDSEVEKQTTESDTPRKRPVSSEEGNIVPWKKMKFTKDDDLVALGLQCTVSGASATPPRPKHKMLHKIIIQSKAASMKAQPKIKHFSTVFVVPPICAGRFVYQVPQTSQNQDVHSMHMPEVQFVAALSTNYATGFELMVKRKEQREEEQRKRADITVKSAQNKPRLSLDSYRSQSQKGDDKRKTL